MGIQFQQVDGLQNTFDNISGNLQAEIDAIEVTGVVSGIVQFSGAKTFVGNVTCSGGAGLGVVNDSIYAYGNSYVVSGLSVGRGINTIRQTTTAPEGKLQVTGGASYFEGDVYVRNNSTLSGHGGEFDNLSISGKPVETGTQNPSFTTVQATSFVSGATLSGSMAYFNNVKITGDPTGILKLHNLPDYTETGALPTPATGIVFRSGNYLMIV